MKRKILSILLVLSLLVIFAVACGNETDTNTVKDTDTNADIITDTSFDTDTDVSTDTDGGEDDLPDTNDVDITLFENGVSEYVIVYPKDNSIIEAQVTELTEYIKSIFEIEISCKAVDKNEDISDKEIIIGDIRDDVAIEAARTKETNDFILDVCGNDFVIYAPNDAVYSYALRIFKDEFLQKAEEGSLIVASTEEFIYQNSEYSNMNFTAYVKEKSEKSSFDGDLLCEAFVGMSFTDSNNTTLPYRLYLPSNYDENTKYPVILFLHGAGERGNDNKKQLINMVPELFNRKDSYQIENAIVVAPQCPGWPNQWVDTPWAEGNYNLATVRESNELKAVVELLELVKSQFSTDENRYYAMGISMGGFGTWDLLMRHGDIFAAAVPVCGGADLSKAELLKNMPIYTAHGKWDTVVPFGNSTKKMVEELKKVGSTSVEYKEYSKAHDIWNDVAKEEKLFEWLFGKSK